MGKKEHWFSAIKRVFIHNSKENLPNESEKKSVKEKKTWGLGRLRHGENNSINPLYRKPSSIEKILGDAEREQQKMRPVSSKQHLKIPPSMPSTDVNHHKEVTHNPTLTPKNHLRHGENNSFIPLYREPSSIEKIQGDSEREQEKMHPVPSEQHPKTPPSMTSTDVNHHKEVTHNPTLTPKNYLRHGENNSFIPLYKEPSTTEKIKGDSEREQQKMHPVPSEQHPKKPPSMPSTDVNQHKEVTHGPKLTPKNHLRNAENNSFISLYREPNSIENIQGDSGGEQQKMHPMPSKQHPKTPPSMPSTDVNHRKEVTHNPTLTPKNNQRHGENNSFIPLYREPNSFKKILGGAEREQQKTRPVSSEQHQNTPPSMPSTVINHYKEVTHNPKNYHTSAIKIQAAYRGYMARRSFRALKGLIRLQGVVRGKNVQRQTMNAMRYMQLLVRVQSQIQSRRIQMLENQALHCQNVHKGDKELDNSLGKWTLIQPSETGHHGVWDDSLLTRQEIEARLQRKMEAVTKRERALAYAYSHQVSPESTTQTALTEIRVGGLPWWWNWLERQLPGHPSKGQTMLAKADPTPSKLILESQSNYDMQPRFGFENLETLTPRSSKSTMAAKTKHVPPPTNGSTPVRLAKLSTSIAEYPVLGVPLRRDDDSLTNCPPSLVPNYMVPTVSAKAKVRANSNPKERSPATPSHQQQSLLSFPLTQSLESPRWNKSSLFSSNNSISQRILGKHKSMQPI